MIKYLLPLLLISNVAYGQQQVCNTRDIIVERLTKQYKEYLNYRALTSDGKLMEIFVAETGTFTIIITTPRGRSCVYGSGEYFQQLKVEPNGGKDT